MKHFQHKPDPANALFHALQKIERVRFTRKLSHDEQRALSPEDEKAYWDWLFGVNEVACLRREREQREFPDEGHDERAERLDREQDYPSGGMK